MPVPHASLNAAGMRKFGGLAEAAEACVERSLERRPRLAQRRFVQSDVIAGRLRRKSREREFQLLALPGDLGAVVSIVLGHAAQQIAKRRHSMARLLRKIGAPKEWLLFL